MLDGTHDFGPILSGIMNEVNSDIQQQQIDTTGYLPHDMANIHQGPIMSDSPHRLSPAPSVSSAVSADTLLSTTTQLPHVAYLINQVWVWLIQAECLHALNELEQAAMSYSQVTLTQAMHFH